MYRRELISALSPSELPLEETWDFFQDPTHLPTASHEAIKLLCLSFFSGVAGLYGVLAYQEIGDVEAWRKYSAIICSTICPAVATYNSTNQVIIDRYSRRTQESLAVYTEKSKHGGFLGITIGSALCSLGLTTPAVNNPDLGNPYLQYFWVFYTLAGNTFLHFWPTDKIAINHPIWGLPLKPFFLLKEVIHNCFSSFEKREARKFLEFKRSITNKLLQNINDRISARLVQKIERGYQWNTTSGSILSWFSFRQKSDDFKVNQRSLIDFLQEDFQSDHILEITPQTRSPGWLGSCKNLLVKAGYVIGGGLILSSCAGYWVDPTYTLQQSGLSQNASAILSLPADYLLGILLIHLGGSNLSADINRLFNFNKGIKSVLPPHALHHTKLFVLITLLNLYTSAFSPYAAIYMVKLHFDQSSLLGKFLLICATAGIPYLSFSSVNEIYRYFMTKLALKNENDSNHDVACVQEGIEAYQRYVFNLEPDAVVHYLRQKSSEELKLLLGQEFFADKVPLENQNSIDEALNYYTDFESRYESVLKASFWTQKTPQTGSLNNPLLESSPKYGA